jgi:predicted metal-binding protein
MKELNQPYEKHIFVCCNTKADGSGCAPKGGEELRTKLKMQGIEKGLYKLRVNKAGCLDFCDNGIAVAVYPEGKFYLDVTKDANLEDFIN